MGALYQEDFVPSLFCGPPGMESHSKVSFLMQNLCWEECGPRFWFASLFIPCVDRLPCALRLFSPISPFLPQLKNFFFLLPLCEKSLCSPTQILCQGSEESGWQVCEERIFLALVLHGDLFCSETTLFIFISASHLISYSPDKIFMVFLYLFFSNNLLRTDFLVCGA